MDVDETAGLALVPDDFKEGEHKSLDEDIRQVVPVVSPANAHLVISEIVTQSGNRLNQKYRDIQNAKELLADNPSVCDMIIQGKYRDVRLLKCLRGDYVPTPSNVMISALGDRDASFAAFSYPYLGGFPAALLKAIDNCPRDEAYHQAVSIIQSSGTGKSRGVEEVARHRFTFLFDLRRNTATYDTFLFAYPHPDACVRDYFMNVNMYCTVTDEIIQARYAAFLCLLFDHTREFLSKCDHQGVALPLWWYTHLNSKATKDQPDPKRVSYYMDVVTGAEALCSQASKTSLFTKLGVACRNFETCLSDEYKRDQSEAVPMNYVACIIAFDEAQELVEEPKKDQVRTRSLYHNLGSVLKYIRSCSVFSIFLSTNFNVRSLAPPARLYPSNRDLRDLLLLRPPVTELPFDIFAKDLYSKLCSEPHKASLSAMCSVEVMACFGRAMWLTLLNSDYSSIIGLAMAKLAPGDFDQDSQLACLGIRIGLDFDASRETGRRKEAELVASHMRIVFTVPEHRDFMLSGTPSEPILAEAAAQLLNDSDVELLAPKVLNDGFQNGILARGERGEMVGWLLWTLAHDNVLRRNTEPREARFHWPIPVVSFLKSLFHKDHWKAVLNARPVGDPDGVPLSEAFKDACIHFSHFVDAMDYNVIKLKQVYRLLLRGAALSCCRNQREVDILTPMLFGSPDSTDIRRSHTSVLQAQIKNRDRTEDILLSPTLVNDINQHPVLSLVHELGSERSGVEPQVQEFHATRSGVRPDRRHYQIVAYGCTSKTYRVIPETRNGMYTMLLGSNLLTEDFPRKHLQECVGMLNQMNPAFELERNDKCQWFGPDLE